MSTDNSDSVSSTITSENNFTDPLTVDGHARVSISIVGSSFTGVVTLQRRLDGTNWRDVETWDSVDAETTYIADETQDVRIGVKTGDFTGTNVAVRLGTG